jgi:hypothetical protein
LQEAGAKQVGFIERTFHVAALKKAAPNQLVMTEWFLLWFGTTTCAVDGLSITIVVYFKLSGERYIFGVPDTTHHDR